MRCRVGPEFNFTDTDWTEYLRSVDIPRLNSWMRLQAARGQAYYRNRLRRIGFHGTRVLDAGCGAGNWAIALASLFEEVVAIDTDPVRLGVLEGMLHKFEGRISAQYASVEKIPFRDNSFDAVFCNGVIFLVETERAIAEFSRVLKPNGMLYITYNGKGWWRHLIYDRGPTEPNCILFGADGLISRYFMLMDTLALECSAAVATKEDAWHRLLQQFPVDGYSGPDSHRIGMAYDLYLKCDDDRRVGLEEAVLVLGHEELTRADGSALRKRQGADALGCMNDLRADTIPSSYRLRMSRDLISRFVLGRSDYTHEIHTYAHEPEEMAEELTRQGFHLIQSAHEGCLCLDSEVPSVQPIYDLRMAVFESLARKS